jgi:hypothetical protein
MKRQSLLIVSIPFFLLTCGTAHSIEFMPVEDIKPGMKGIGKTVFHGTEVEDFDVEVMGILKNARPKSDLILVKLSGGPLEESGLIAGMSGSPVYIGGKLVGAIALSLGSFSKEPVGAAVPIGEMLAPQDLGALGMESPQARSEHSITPIATPVVCAGFDSRTIDWLAPCISKFGLVPMAGGGGGRAASAPPVPGSVLAVKLVEGDFDMSAVGTLTYIDGNKFYAWGHQMFQLGATELPASGGYVYAVYKSSMSSFKIASSTDDLGAVLQDRTTGVSGRLGATAKTLPLNLSVTQGKTTSNYRMNVILSEMITPSLLASAVMNSVLSSGSLLGETTIQAEMSVKLEGHAPLKIETAYSDSSTVVSLARDVMDLIGAIIGNGFEKARFESVQVNLVVIEQRKSGRIVDASVDRPVANPGDTIAVTVRVRPFAGKEYSKTVSLEIPRNTPAGDLLIKVTDGVSASMDEAQRNPLSTDPRSLDELLDLIRSSKPANSIVVTASSSDKSVYAREGEMPSVPPSFLAIVRKSQPQPLPEAPAVCCEKTIKTEEVINGTVALKVKVEEK